MDQPSDEPAPEFTMDDLVKITEALAHVNLLWNDSLPRTQSRPFCLFIQGASPASEIEWLESVYALPDAKVSR